MHVESVFVTGSNRGLGFQFVKQFVELESPPKHVFAACRNPGEAKDLEDLKEKHSGRTEVHILQLEMTNEDQIKSCVEQTTNILGDRGLTLLINNAGVMPKSLFPNITSEEYLNHYKINVMGPMLLAQALLPLLKLASTQNETEAELSVERAAIFNMAAGIASFHDVNFKIWCDVDAYRMTKAAYHMGSAIQARELRPHNILVLIVHPGWVATDLGGPMAPITGEESVKHMMNILETAGEKQHGVFLDYEGKQLPW